MRRARAGRACRAGRCMRPASASCAVTCAPRQRPWPDALPPPPAQKSSTVRPAQGRVQPGDHRLRGPRPAARPRPVVQRPARLANAPRSARDNLQRQVPANGAGDGSRSPLAPSALADLRHTSLRARFTRRNTGARCRIAQQHRVTIFAPRLRSKRGQYPVRDSPAPRRAA